AEAAPLPPVVERLTHQLRIALHATLVVREAAIGVVLEVASQLADTPLDSRVLVDLPPHPAAAAAVEETHQPVRISVAVAEELAEIVGDARHRPARTAAEAALAQALDLAPKLIAHPLVGIEAEHPV